jgi:hypothetical protein
MKTLRVVLALTIWALLTGMASASSIFDLDCNGSFENNWGLWNSGSTAVDFTTDPGWACVRHDATSTDWGMTINNGAADLSTLTPPFTVEAHFKQDPPDGQGGYLQVLAICYNNTGNPGDQGYELCGGKGYIGNEQRIIGYSGQRWGGTWSAEATDSFTDSSVENAQDLYVIFVADASGHYAFGFKSTAEGPYVCMPTRNFPAGHPYYVSYIQSYMFFNGGHSGVPAPSSPDHWTYKTDYIHVNPGAVVTLAPYAPSKVVTFDVSTTDTVQNASNLINAAKTHLEPGEDLEVRVPNAVYDDPIGGLDLRANGPVRFVCATDPIPKVPAQVDDAVTTGAFILDEVWLTQDTTLENLIFTKSDFTPGSFIDVNINNIHLKNCRFIGDNRNEGRAFEKNRNFGSGFIVENCYIEGFHYGVGIDETHSTLIDTVFVGNRFGFLGQAGINLVGKTSGCCFYRNDKVAFIGEGTGYLFDKINVYDQDGVRITDISALESQIVDRRPSSTPTPGGSVASIKEPTKNEYPRKGFSLESVQLSGTEGYVRPGVYVRLNPEPHYLFPEPSQANIIWLKHASVPGKMDDDNNWATLHNGS